MEKFLGRREEGAKRGEAKREAEKVAAAEYTKAPSGEGKERRLGEGRESASALVTGEGVSEPATGKAPGGKDSRKTATREPFKRVLIEGERALGDEKGLRMDPKGDRGDGKDPSGDSGDSGDGMDPSVVRGDVAGV